MKNFLIALGLGLAVTASADTAFKAEQFINGYDVIITNNQTLQYAATNVAYKYGSAGIQQNLSLTNWSIPRTLVGTTAYYTNSPVQNTNIVNPAAWRDVDLYSDRNQNAGAPSLTIVASGTTAVGTNELNFTFWTLSDGTNQDNVTSSSIKSFGYTMAITGNTNLVMTTNLPAALCTGSAKLRLVTLRTANSTTNDYVYLRSVTLNGFR